MANDNKPSFALRANIWTLRLARNWLKIALTFLAIYISLPFAAPVLMKAGAESAGQVLYTLYTPFCHQFAFRSFFLFGEQPVYPRANAGTDWTPFEAYASSLPAFEDVDLTVYELPMMMASRSFKGNETMGYKMTLCERDIFIYLAMFTGGIIYTIPNVRRRLRPVPLWLYVFLGLGPIGLDGFSQWFGYPPFNFWESRETMPEFRVLTGAVFGFMTAWLAFPYFEMAMQDTRREIEAKLHRAGISLSSLAD